MPILSDNPIIIPATEIKTEEKIYNIWWLNELHIVAPNANGDTPVSARIVFQAMRELDDGGFEYHPDSTKELNISDLFSLAKDSPEMGGLFNSVIDACGNLGKSFGVIS